MPITGLSEEEFNDLLQITITYQREADKCAKGRAYLAGCVMLGPALEAALLTFTDCHLDVVEQSGKVPIRNGKPKPLRDWTLAQLVVVARDLDWLPAGLALEEAWDKQRAKIGDYADVVRQARNLVHPVRYLEDYPATGIKKKQFEFIYDILSAAVDHLLERLYASLEQHRAMESTTPKAKRRKSSRSKS